MDKLCCKCKRLLESKYFSKKTSSKDGLNPSCKECHNKYTKMHYKNNKQYYLDKAIKNNPAYKKEHRKWYLDTKGSMSCVRCGENHPACLDFHHINPTNKVDTISSMFSNGKSKEEILNEMSKCIVLCSNCHRKEHFYKKIIGGPVDSGADSTKV